jgi:hypothetical protein
VAQLGARLNGIQEVTGSIPVGSTKTRGEDSATEGPGGSDVPAFLFFVR